MKGLDEQHEMLQTSVEVMQASCTLARDAIERGTADPARTLYAREHLVADLQRMKAQPLVLQPTESAQLVLKLPVDTLLDTVVGFGCVGEGPGTPQSVQCKLQGATASLTWQPPEPSVLPIVAYVVERAVGGSQYAAAGRRDGNGFFVTVLY